MAHILVRPAVLAVITLSLLLSAGSYGPFGGRTARPTGSERGEQGHRRAQHRLFKEGRGAYEEAKERPPTPEKTPPEKPSASRRRGRPGRRRGAYSKGPANRSRRCGNSTSSVRSGSTPGLSEAVDVQIAAENREIDFYELLEQDPTLEDSREEAESILSEVGEGYGEAYERVQEIAATNPELLRES